MRDEGKENSKHTTSRTAITRFKILKAGSIAVIQVWQTGEEGLVLPMVAYQKNTVARLLDEQSETRKDEQ